jgi:hypothetical protein
MAGFPAVVRYVTLREMDREEQQEREEKEKAGVRNQVSLTKRHPTKI